MGCIGELVKPLSRDAVARSTVGTSVGSHHLRLNMLFLRLDLLRWGQNGEAMRGMPEITPDMEREILTTVIDAFMASALVTCV